ncbi:hypothetical protein [Streptomyces sp. NPDC012616]|uniref:hypothetical protein n=1 Tax=Streptomyces sp. NPDC012616 TaxID=3364840 RepID=UPI0036E268DD
MPAPPLVPLLSAVPTRQGPLRVIQYRAWMPAGQSSPVVDGMGKPGQLPCHEGGGAGRKQPCGFGVAPLRAHAPHQSLGQCVTVSVGDQTGQTPAQHGRCVDVRLFHRLVRYGQVPSAAPGVTGDDPRRAVGRP